MSRREYRARRAHCYPGRTEYSKRRLREAGVTVLSEDKTHFCIHIEYKGRRGRYHPFTGYWVVDGMEPGRGIEELIAVI